MICYILHAIHSIHSYTESFKSISLLFLTFTYNLDAKYPSRSVLFFPMHWMVLLHFGTSEGKKIVPKLNSSPAISSTRDHSPLRDGRASSTGHLAAFAHLIYPTTGHHKLGASRIYCHNNPINSQYDFELGERVRPNPCTVGSLRPLVMTQRRKCWLGYCLKCAGFNLGLAVWVPSNC